MRIVSFFLPAWGFFSAPPSSWNYSKKRRLDLKSELKLDSVGDTKELLPLNRKAFSLSEQLEGLVICYAIPLFYTNI